MKPKYIFISLILITLVAFLLRLITMSSPIPTDDPLYNLRQIDSLIANNLNYTWFDPLNMYQSDATVFWGPLFPTMIAALCLMTGVNTVLVASIVPPILAALITIPAFFLGKSFGNWKTGLIASAFTAVIGGQFFYRSTFGFVDHHIAEVLFSTLFCLLYIFALRSIETNKIVIVSFFAGIAYVLGFLTMPTMILFAMIVGIFTVINPSKKLVIINTAVFGTAILGTLLFGIKASGFDLSSYSIGHPIAYLSLIMATILLYLISTRLSKKLYIGFISVIALTTISISYIFNISFITNLLSFFGQSAITNTVSEAQGWGIVQMGMSFNIGTLLAIGGAFFLLLAFLKTRDDASLFVLVWSFIILFSTWQHVRYEYYVAINIALLAAIFVTSIKTKHVGAILAGVFIILSIYSILTIPIPTGNDDLQLSLEWMEKNTPSPGVDYYKVYNKSFVYPPESYSVMSWWDYGHAITYYAHRIPVANPFQQGVSGPMGAASYFMSIDENAANKILDYHHTKYVVVDKKMATDDLWAMAAWANVTPDYNETVMVKLYKEELNNYTLVHKEGEVKIFECGG